MAKEIERKYLVADVDALIAMATERHKIAQGYLCADPNRTVRIRLCDDAAFITVKTRNVGATRNEWEYPIPVSDAREMLTACPTRIEKTRYIVPFEGYTWEVDLFHGPLAPLCIAEIELPAEDTSFTLPPHLGPEVTGDPRYYNSNLAKVEIDRHVDR